MRFFLVFILPQDLPAGKAKTAGMQEAGGENSCPFRGTTSLHLTVTAILEY